MHILPRCGRWALPIGALTALTALVGVADQGAGVRARPADDSTTLDSRAGDARLALGGRRPSVSGDGRLVAFVGAPQGRSDERTSTAYVRDRATDVLVQVTPAGPGMRDGETAAVVLSSDGCSVTVLTQMPLNLFDDDDAGDRWDVYRAPLPRCSAAAARDGLDWELVSADVDGSSLDAVDPDSRVAVSATGTTVAFVVPVVRGSELRRVLVADLTVAAGEPGRLAAVPGMPLDGPDGGSSHLGQVEPAVSGDGTLIAFTSDALADAAVPTWTEARRLGAVPPTQVYAWDRPSGTVELVSGLPSAEPGSVPSGRAGQPSVSSDGRRVAFVSTSRDLVAARYPDCAADGCTIGQVFVRDRDRNDDGFTGDAALLLASRRHASRDSDVFVAGNRSSSTPSLSADGSTVAYVTRSTNLIAGLARPGADASDGDILVTDLGSGKVRRASVRSDSVTPATAAHSSPALSANGRVVTFETGAAAQMVARAPGDGSRQIVSTTFPAVLSMPALDVGTVPPAWRSPEWFVAVTNTGASSFVPARIESSDPQFEVTGGTCFGSSVSPGGSCTVRVAFTPLAAGDVTATLTVAEEGFRAAHVTAVLAGSGGEPYLSATPAGLAFDPTEVGSTSPAQSVTVANTAYEGTVVNDVRITGPDPDDFRVVSTSCGSASLAPTGDCSLEVVFTPTADGVRSALATITTTSGSRTSVVLGGIGRYRPAVAATEVVRAGHPVVLMGSGYAPGTALVIAWADGTGRQASVRTDATGAFATRFPTSSRERPGERELVISDPTLAMSTERVSVMVQPDR